MDHREHDETAVQRIFVAWALAALVGCAVNTPTPLYPQPTTGDVASPMVVATPTSSATVTQAPTPIAVTRAAALPKPEIISFTVSPTMTNAPGQNISIEWQAKGEKAEVCGVVETTLTDCRPLPVSGKTTYTTTSSSVNFPVLVLRVTTKSDSITASVPVMLCVDSTRWFFSPAPARCAEPANISRGAAQNFEHGMMLWISKPDHLFIFYADTKQTFEMASAPYSFKPGASPNNRIGGAPSGLFEPVSGFGQLWRGEIVGVENARQRLGWATAPESAFDAAYQCQFSAPRLWSCYLRDPRDQVLRLRPDSTAQVNLLWSVVSTK